MLKLDRYVRPKTNRHGKTYYYFRIVRDGKETNINLGHPLDDGYRSKYNEAWKSVFGVYPHLPVSGKRVVDLCNAHEASAAYRSLKGQSVDWRNRTMKLLKKTWGQFEAWDIRPVHFQELYDILADKPPTANRYFDDISKIWAWGVPREFVEANHAATVERITVRSGYEPWPEWAIHRYIGNAPAHLVRAFLVAVYTGQRKDDVLTLRFCDIEGDVWQLREQGKTGNDVPVPLHPVAQAVIEEERTAMLAGDVIDLQRPVLTTSRGTSWGSGFGASFAKSMRAIKISDEPHETRTLADMKPRLVFHGLRTTNATLIASDAATGIEGIDRVKAMLGHLSERMARHYARRAMQERSNRSSVTSLKDLRDKS